MSADADYAEPRRPTKEAMARISALSTATKLQLGGGILLLIDLFLTWQNVEIDYGSTGVVSALDGWNLSGGLLGLLTLALLAIVIVRETRIELSPDVPWGKITLGLGVGILAVTVLKNLLESGSTWASYLGVLLAAVVAFGAYRDWRERGDEVFEEDLEPTSRWEETPRRSSERPTRSQRARPSQRW